MGIWNTVGGSGGTGGWLDIVCTERTEKDLLVDDFSDKDNEDTLSYYAACGGARNPLVAGSNKTAAANKTHNIVSKTSSLLSSLEKKLAASHNIHTNTHPISFVPMLREYLKSELYEKVLDLANLQQSKWLGMGGDGNVPCALGTDCKCGGGLLDFENPGNVTVDRTIEKNAFENVLKTAREEGTLHKISVSKLVKQLTDPDMGNLQLTCKNNFLKPENQEKEAFEAIKKDNVEE